MEYMIKMVDLQRQYIKIKKEIDQSIQEVIDSTAFINGQPVNTFATELGDYLKVKHVIPCANGTDALQIAYQTLGLQPGDEVLMPPFNYVASAEAAVLLGLKPVFVDVHEETFNMNEQLIQEKITPATKAIVVVHLFGQTANMEPILNIAETFGLKVIEDTAQSLGSEYHFSDGRIMKAGTMGHLNTHSFFPTKNLGCFGDGGAISTNDDELAQRAKMIARHGQGEKYSYDLIGCNSRLDTMQAAILRVKLSHLDQYLKNRIGAAQTYNQLLEQTAQIITPTKSEASLHTYNQYVIRVRNRDLIKQMLQKQGVPSMIYYPSPMHLQKAYAFLGYQEGDYPVAEKLCHEVLALPIHTELTLEEQKFIVGTLINTIKSL